MNDFSEFDVVAHQSVAQTAVGFQNGGAAIAGGVVSAARAQGHVMFRISGFQNELRGGELQLAPDEILAQEDPVAVRFLPGSGEKFHRPGAVKAKAGFRQNANGGRVDFVQILFCRQRHDELQSVLKYTFFPRRPTHPKRPCRGREPDARSRRA